MDNTEFEHIDFGATNRSRNKTCSKCNSADHTITRCSLNPCGNCKLPGHISLSCLIKKEESQARKRIRSRNSTAVREQRSCREHELRAGGAAAC